MNIDDITTKHLDILDERQDDLLLIGKATVRSIIQKYVSQKDIQGKIDAQFQAQVLMLAIITRDRAAPRCFKWVV